LQSEKDTDIFNFFSSLKRRKEAKEETPFGLTKIFRHHAKVKSKRRNSFWTN
jgi:hypothetical protein